MLVQSRSQTQSSVVDSSKPKIDYDVVIVGGGIVGATLACGLKDSGLKITIIESQQPEVAISKKQAYALTLQTGRILKSIGVWDEIVTKITTFYQINLSDSDYHRVVQFMCQDLGTDQLGYVGEHGIILSAMYEFLSQCPNVSWQCPASLKNVNYHPDYVEVEIENQGNLNTFYSKIIVAADGSKSRLREEAGIKTHGWKYWQSCIAMTIKTEKSHQNIAFERFWPSGPMGVLPLPGNRCQVVWTAPHAEAQALKELDETEFLKLLEYRTGGLLGKLELLSDRYVYPVQLMQSDRYIQHRLALVGDAAHCCHPVGGQGLNMGIRDGGALAEVLKIATQKGEDIGQKRVLKRYEGWRQKENLIVLGLTDFLDRTFSGDWTLKVSLRRLGLGVLTKVQIFRYLALRLMTGLIGRAPKLNP
ncbi:putative 2-octaprenyl-6-methoxyphenol 4-monooxygenase [Planktothrix agardhii CCAP 1459/11A]|uniref:Putative 2-octaprenyl-6-methoxyphenol 4-monooxygenase n=1 Tax=Planktothrix agardhii CCAP 1459/11A TaxID=282420 RepID=A0A4P5ZWJ0_PLAAG|nr:FAD-dependent hydroxylase [Planktothrix agardhii]GDZ94465.1 putative 2-octaprenyl-6-methoxyphenol 4-monooxygenase [Planktothrix agardhii CCAP 1459/11A]